MVGLNILPAITTSPTPPLQGGDRHPQNALGGCLNKICMSNHLDPRFVASTSKSSRCLCFPPLKGSRSTVIENQAEQSFDALALSWHARHITRAYVDELFCSPLISQLQAVSPLLVVRLYADDLLVYLEAMPRPTVRVMKGVIAALQRFGDFSGLRPNYDKTRFLLRGFWPDPVRQQLAELGCKADSSTRYLGIQLGDVSPEEAFAPALAKAMTCARSVAHFSLDLLERSELLQTWILPIFAFPAKACFPSSSVCSSLRFVYLAALRLNSWSLTLPHLERTKQQGGIRLPQPRTYLLWQHASAFVSYVHSLDRFLGAVGNHFRRWTYENGLSVPRRRCRGFSWL